MAAFANADAQLRSQDLPREDKINAARRCILSFTRFSSFPLSDINISAIMHRVCRLVTHRGLIETRTGGGSGAGYPNLDHVPLMEGLLDDVIARAKLQLLLTQPELSTEAKSAEPTPVTPMTIAADNTNNSKFQDSTAALALYSSGTIGMHISQSDIDILASIILSFRQVWTEQRIVMVLLALSRLGVIHGKLQQNSPTSKLLDALYTASEERRENFSAEELSTLVWGFATVDYTHLKNEYLTQVMATMLPKVGELALVGVYNTLEGLMLHEWAPPAPKNAWLEVKNDHNVINNYIASDEFLDGFDGGSSSGGGVDTFGSLQMEDSQKQGRFQVKDLRELQSLAKAWEQQRRSELAEFLRRQQQQEGDGARSSSSSSLIETQHDHQLQLTSDTRGGGGGTISGMNLGALAQSAMRVRAERASKAQLNDVAAKVVRELRASVIPTQSLETPLSSVNVAGFEPSEENDALVARLLTGKWEERKKTNTEKSKCINKATATGILLEDNHSLDTSPAVQDSNAECQNQQQNSNTSGRGRHRIFRVGPLFAEYSINPSSGREIIQPHYERAQLWDPMVFQSSQHASEQSVLGEEFEFVHLDDDEDVADLKYNSSSQDVSTLPKTILATTTTTSDAVTEAASAAIEALAQRVSAMIPDARPDQAISLARYFSALRHYDRELLIAVKDKVEELLENYNPPPPPEEDKSFSTDDGNAFSNTAKTTNTTTPTLHLKSIYFADFLWIFASLGVVDLIPPELSRKAMHAALLDRDIPAVGLSRAAWSLAVLGHLDGSTLKTICARIVSDQSTKNTKDVGVGDAMKSSDEEILKIDHHHHNSNNAATTLKNRIILKQLFQAALQVEISTGESHETLLPAELRTTAAAAWNDRRNFLSTSYLQRQVAGVLQNSLGLDCQLEHAPEDSFVVIDIAVFAKNNKKTKVAVEVDGPYHYSTNKLTHKLGAMQLRDSLLRHSGWEVVSIPYYEWMQAKPWEKAKYLEGKVMPILQSQRQR